MASQKINEILDELDLKVDDVGIDIDEIDLDLEDEGDYDAEIDKRLIESLNREKSKPPLPVRLFWTIVPSARDSLGELIRKAVFIFSSVIAVTCLVLILKEVGSNNAQLKTDEGYRQVKQEIELTGNIPLDVEKIERVKAEVPNILDEYIPFYDINPDLVGWIRIPGTIIDYPVVQNDDNEYYLTHSFEGAESSYGTIFADFNVPLTPTSRPNNTVLYGHNIANGSYFASVTNYFPRKTGSLNYYLQNPIVEFDTIYEKGVYKVFAGIYINTQPEHDNGYVYEYFTKRRFKDKAAFYDFAQNIMDRSVFFTDVDLEYGDEIITLSTCYYPLGNHINTRFALFARRVREGEDPAVDTSKASINPNPLYFELYHNALGIKWAGRNWDTSLVKGLDEFLAENPEMSTVD